MENINFLDVCEFVNENIVDFHQRRISSLENLSLQTLLKKNPYLFKAKNITTANELITGLLDAFLSSSEEKLFGDFLEELAVFLLQVKLLRGKSPLPREWILSSLKMIFAI